MVPTKTQFISFPNLTTQAGSCHDVGVSKHHISCGTDCTFASASTFQSKVQNRFQSQKESLLKACIWLAGICLFAFHSIESSAAQPFRILCLGDSLTEGYGLKPEQAWPVLLETELKKKNPHVKVINGGISGSTSASGMGRLKWHLKTHQKEPFNLMILALGANDALRGFDPESMKKNLSDVIDLAHKSDIPVLLAGMRAPPNLGKTYLSKYENVFIDLSKRKLAGFVPFILEGVAGVPSFNLPDGIHPNVKGHQIIKDSMFKVVNPLIK
jgi:acyl-CoA thioesterase-1